MLLPDEIVTVRRDHRIKQMHLNISYLGPYISSWIFTITVYNICICKASILSAKNLMRMKRRDAKYLLSVESVIFRCLI